MDLPGAEERLALLQELAPLPLTVFRVSAETGAGLEALRQAIYQALDVVRVYTKLPTKKEPDLDRPFTVKRGSTLLDVAELIHRDLAAHFKYARVWGSKVLSPGAVMKGDYVVQDKDIVEIHA
jgi:ribosome-interacting GTPase 1